MTDQLSVPFASEFPVDPDAPADLAAWRSEAIDRGYSYANEWVRPELAGLLFSEGEDAVATDVADALNSGSPFLAGSLSANYAAAGAAVASSFIAFPLPRSMPSVVLVNARHGALRQANIGMGSRQMLSLKGNFDRSFTLYCPIGHEKVALEMFTPELMQMFLEAIPGSDAELVDDWLFVYGSAGRCTSPDSLDRIERLASRVHAEFARRTFDSMRAEPEAPPEPAASRLGVLRFSLILAVTTLAAGALAWLAMMER